MHTVIWSKKYNSYKKYKCSRKVSFLQVISYKYIQNKDTKLKYLVRFSTVGKLLAVQKAIFNYIGSHSRLLIISLISHHVTLVSFLITLCIRQWFTGSTSQCTLLWYQRLNTLPLFHCYMQRVTVNLWCLQGIIIVQRVMSRKMLWRRPTTFKHTAQHYQWLTNSFWLQFIMWSVLFIYRGSQQYCC